MHNAFPQLTTAELENYNEVCKGEIRSTEVNLFTQKPAKAPSRLLSKQEHEPECNSCTAHTFTRHRNLKQVTQY